MPNQNVLFSDNFTRANENPLSDGGQWGPFQEVGVNLPQLQVVSNKAEASSTAGRNVSIVTGTSFPSNQWCELTPSSVTSGVTALKLRSTSGNPGTAYDVAFSVSGWQIQRESGTTFSVLATIGGSLVVGHAYLFTAIGNVLSLFDNGTLVGSTTDNTLTTGTVGIRLNPGTPVTNLTFSLFRAGNFSSANQLMLTGCGT